MFFYIIDSWQRLQNEWAPNVLQMERFFLFVDTNKSYLKMANNVNYETYIPNHANIARMFFSKQGSAVEGTGILESRPWKIYIFLLFLCASIIPINLCGGIRAI